MPTAREVADVLLREIRTAHRPVGDLLDSDEAVAQRFGVSKDVARRAWLHLAKGGFVARKHGEGTFVADKKPISLEDRVAAIEERLDRIESERNPNA